MSGRPEAGAIAFSVIVPSHNRPSQLRECLEALARQDYPRDRYETIVVDDGGSTPLEDVVGPFEERMSVRLLRQARSGPGPARNAGARAARGQWLAFTDDDCRPSTGWLRELEPALGASTLRAVGGMTVNALDRSRCSSASQLLVAYLYASFRTPSGHPRFFASNNLALGAELFAQTGGFDMSVPLFPAEDRELCDRLAEAGCALVLAPDALVRHAHPLTLRGFCRQHFVYGRAACRYHRLRSTRRHDRIRLERLPFYWNLVRYPFRARETRPWSIALLLTLSQIVHTAGFVWERLSPRGGKPSTY